MENTEKNFTIETIPLEYIVVEDRFDRDGTRDLEIEALAKDIKNNGQDTEIWLNKVSDIEYLLIAGYRRYLAFKSLDMDSIRAKVFCIDETKSLYLSCRENLNRLGYSETEKIQSFLYLLHRELQLISNSGAPKTFAPALYAQLFQKIAKKHKYDEEGKHKLSLKNLSKDETILSEVFEKVYRTSGLFQTYGKLSDIINLESMSNEYKKLCKDYHLPMVSVRKLHKTCGEFGDEEFVENGEAKKYTDAILSDIIQLEKKELKYISRIIDRYKAKKANLEISDKSETIKANMNDVTSRLIKAANGNTLGKRELKILAKLAKTIEKELDKIQTGKG